MKPRRSNRAFAVVLAAVFLLLGAGDLFGLRACPHHEAGHGGPAGEDHRHAAHVELGDDELPTPEATHEPCSCAGFCPPTSAIGLPPDPALEVAPAEVASGEVIDARHGVDLPRLIPYFLPYAQAPPSDG